MIMPVGRRYEITLSKPAVSLRALRLCALWCAEFAVRACDCEPARVIAELRGVLETLRERWSGKNRGDVLHMPACVDMSGEPAWRK